MYSKIISLTTGRFRIHNLIVKLSRRKIYFAVFADVWLEAWDIALFDVRFFVVIVFIIFSDLCGNPYLLSLEKKYWAIDHWTKKMKENKEQNASGVFRLRENIHEMMKTMSLSVGRNNLQSYFVVHVMWLHIYMPCLSWFIFYHFVYLTFHNRMWNIDIEFQQKSVWEN